MQANPTPDGGERVSMFDEIMQKFEGSPSQQSVIRLLLERGFSVNDEGRVVDSTTEAILADDELRPIFQNISAIPSLMDLAPVLDLTVLTIEVVDAGESGIVATITSMIADRDISIRQTVSEDPEFTENPKLYIITETDIPGDLINEIRAQPFVQKIELK